MKKIINILLFFLCGCNVYAQMDVEMVKNAFRKGKDGFDDAWAKIEEAQTYYEDDTKGSYLIALKYYMDAYRYNPDYAPLNYRLGVCYIRSVQKNKAIGFFQKAYQLNAQVAVDVLYLLAKAYQYNYEFDKAKQTYEQFAQSLSPVELQEWHQFIAKREQECDYGKKYVDNPARVFIDNIGENINTAYAEYSPVVNADESMMIFTSRRDGTKGGQKDPYDLEFYEDMYVSYRVNGKWNAPANMDSPVNSNEHDATVGLSADGQHLFFYRAENGGDLYESVFENGHWGKPGKLPDVINTPFHESSATYSPNGKEFYYVSDEPEYSLGQSDIYLCQRNAKGKWKAFQNLGATINTPYNEEGVFLHPDGRTLFFSSEGHTSMGGLDIFRSIKQNDGTWSEPENLGYPINTPDDDVFFVTTASGKYAYYSSVRTEGFGDRDIYRVTFLGDEKPLIRSNEDNLIACLTQPVAETAVEQAITIKTIRLTVVKGIVTDSISGKPVAATIDIVDNSTGEVMSSTQSDPQKGAYMFTLPSGKNYGISVNATDYLFYSANFDIPPTAVYQEIDQDIKLLNVSVNSKIVMNNVFFELGKSTLLPASYPEIVRLADLMNQYPALSVEISGHTDNTGDESYNVTLSEARAKSVVDYMTNTLLIFPSRLQYKGYGQYQPIATNDTEEGRSQNRRVEFKVLSNK